MSAGHFEVCSIWATPRQKATLLAECVARDGNPLACTRQAKRRHNTLKDQAVRVRPHFERAPASLAAPAIRVGELKTKNLELEAQEHEAARIAATAFGEQSQAQRPQSVDPPDLFLQQLAELGLEQGMLGTVKAVVQSRDKAKAGADVKAKPEQQAVPQDDADLREGGDAAVPGSVADQPGVVGGAGSTVDSKEDIDVDEAVRILKQGEWLDHVEGDGEGGATRSQLDAAPEEEARAAKKGK
ncbi:unnamed protein product [Prorocentrum cordatum]|uniref:Ribosome biogenesis protein NOP53 n=1 Tax=Prorocentrum cordatum TaxID=2364126 RepID=A0ABN9QL92_9DINO|nr:unnamed protein product [Polarella glacialis]